MNKSKVLNVTVFEVDGEKGEYCSEIMIACSPVTLTGALCEAIYKINEAVNESGKLPKNVIWTLVCEMISDRLLEESEK